MHSGWIEFVEGSSSTRAVVKVVLLATVVEVVVHTTVVELAACGTRVFGDGSRTHVVVELGGSSCSRSLDGLVGSTTRVELHLLERDLAHPCSFRFVVVLGVRSPGLAGGVLGEPGGYALAQLREAKKMNLVAKYLVLT